jgi:hypothetical protein
MTELISLLLPGDGARFMQVDPDALVAEATAVNELSQALVLLVSNGELFLAREVRKAILSIVNPPELVEEDRHES